MNVPVAATLHITVEFLGLLAIYRVVYHVTYNGGDVRPFTIRGQQKFTGFLQRLDIAPQNIGEIVTRVHAGERYVLHVSSIDTATVLLLLKEYAG